MAPAGAETLSYAVRPRVVAHFLGQLGLMLALLTAAPLLASLWFREFAATWRYGLVVLALLALSWPAARLRVPRGVQRNEAFTVTALAFLLAPLAMVFPIHGATELDFVPALFEAVSAATTTGLTMVPAPEAQPRTFLFARAWMQWYGGLGIAVLSIALLMGQAVATHRLVDAAATETFVTTSRTHARRVLQVYAGLTVLAIAVLALLAGDFEEGLLHALAAVSTGGFSTHGDSLAATSTPFASAVLGCSLLGAITLPLYYGLFRERASRLRRDREWSWFLAAVLAGAGLLGAALYLGAGLAPGEAVRQALLLSASAQSTAGFSVLAPAELPAVALGVLLAQMLVGGCVGSTAGGVKILNLLILVRALRMTLARAGMGPHAVARLRLFGEALEPRTLERVLLLLVLYGLVVFLSWLLFLAHGLPPLASLFEVVSATGTVGLSAGIAGPELPPLLALVLCFDMLAGRVEVVALLVALWPGTWIGRRQAA
ncbi:MAG: potassium transporter TrkG [Pseudomonadales bacterium]|jgi:trk system potassium uptake protein TrkH|nr:potassium transporter TrkG [Pseudomonadales bacterium]